MTIAQAFNDIATAQGGTPSKSGTIAGAIDALNDALAGSDQAAAETIEDAVRLLGAHIGGGSTPTGTISITENGEGIDVAQYAYADVNVSGGSQTYELSYELTTGTIEFYDMSDPNYDDNPTPITSATAGMFVSFAYLVGGEFAEELPQYFHITAGGYTIPYSEDWEFVMPAANVSANDNR